MNVAAPTDKSAHDIRVWGLRMRWIPVLIGLVVLGCALAFVSKDFLPNSMMQSFSGVVDSTTKMSGNETSTVNLIQERLNRVKAIRLSKDEREYLSEACRPHHESVSEWCHALPIYGPSMMSDFDYRGRYETLSVMLDSEFALRLFGEPLFIKTQYGARASKNEAFYLDSNQNAAESHYGQFLSALALEGISLEHPIRYVGGESGNVHDFLREIKASYSSEGEIYWDAVSLSVYATEGEREWQDKFGESHRFDELMTELLSRSDSHSSCVGTHKAISIAILLAADEINQLLSIGIREEAESYISGLVRDLVASLHPEGYWRPDWFNHLPDRSPLTPPAQDTVEGRMLATSHHLYWMLLLPERLQPRDELYAQCGSWLKDQLLKPDRDSTWWEENYCPASHTVYIVLKLAVDED